MAVDEEFFVGLWKPDNLVILFKLIVYFMDVLLFDCYNRERITISGVKSICNQNKYMH